MKNTMLNHHEDGMMSANEHDEITFIHLTQFPNELLNLLNGKLVTSEPKGDIDLLKIHDGPICNLPRSPGPSF